MNLWLVLWLMLFSIVWMDGVCHICRDYETISDYPEVVLSWHVRFEVEGNALAGFNNKVAVCTLGGLGTDFFMIEEHYHANLCILLRIIFMVVYD